MLNRRLHRLVWVNTCQNATLLEITCQGSFVVHAFPVSILWLWHTTAFFVVCRLFSKSTYLKILSGIPSECETAWIQIRPDILSGLIWVQTAETVCKGYQQKTLVGKKQKAHVVKNEKFSSI